MSGLQRDGATLDQVTAHTSGELFGRPLATGEWFVAGVAGGFGALGATFNAVQIGWWAWGTVLLALVAGVVAGLLEARSSERRAAQAQRVHPSRILGIFARPPAVSRRRYRAAGAVQIGLPVLAVLLLPSIDTPNGVNLALWDLALAAGVWRLVVGVWARGWERQHGEVLLRAVCRGHLQLLRAPGAAGAASFVDPLR